MRPILLLNIIFSKSKGGSKANRICDFRGYFLFAMSKWGKERSLQEAVVDDDAYSFIVVKTGIRIAMRKMGHPYWTNVRSARVSGNNGSCVGLKFPSGSTAENFLVRICKVAFLIVYEEDAIGEAYCSKS